MNEGPVAAARAEAVGSLERLGFVRPGPPAPRPVRRLTPVLLRVVLAGGQDVLLRTLAVATGEVGHWPLEGEWWERAVTGPAAPLPAADLAGTLAAMLRAPGSGAG